MSYYEFVMLDIVIFGVGKVVLGIEVWVVVGEGWLCGVWGIDIGMLNCVFVLCVFDDFVQMYVECECVLCSDDLFGCIQYLVGLLMESYCVLDFLFVVEFGIFGLVYEFCIYCIKINGIMLIMQKWCDVIFECEIYFKLFVVMYGLDGVLCLMQIWFYVDLVSCSKVCV